MLSNLVEDSSKRMCLQKIPDTRNNSFDKNSSSVALEKLDKSTQFHFSNTRPWYMVNGKLRPKFGTKQHPKNPTTRINALLPNTNSNDRIPEQLMFLPSKYPETDDSRSNHKKIVLWNGPEVEGGFMEGKDVKMEWKFQLLEGKEIFIKENCPVSTCTISSRQSDALQADLLLFKDEFKNPDFSRPMNQVWLIYLLESPVYTNTYPLYFSFNDIIFNWTSTYRSDSTIVAPYGRWQYYDDNIKQLPLKRNFAENKTKSVAWVVSNCHTNNGRMEYAKALGEYIQVDIYGKCGNKKCSYSKSDNCFKSLGKDYKFYLAFENSNCRDYITEKFYYNALGNDMIPIVMGARPEDYKRVAPHKSYIHIDDFEGGPKQLANYLIKLEGNDELYNEYFTWKGTGEMINTKYLCRLCAMLHEPAITDVVRELQPQNFNDWWNAKGTCINGSWKAIKT